MWLLCHTLSRLQLVSQTLYNILLYSMSLLVLARRGPAEQAAGSC